MPPPPPKLQVREPVIQTDAPPPPAPIQIEATKKEDRVEYKGPPQIVPGPPPPPAPVVPAGPRYTTAQWIMPSSDQLMDLYPPRAQDAEVEGEVTIDCVLNAEGKITGCTVESEKPAGYGFGAATVKGFMRYAKIKKGSDGELRDGDRRKFRFKWTLQ